MNDPSRQTSDGRLRDRLRHLIEHLEHVLPGQAPIKDFVHHNTLHGLQHLRFTEALAEAERLTGARGYLPAERFRAFYQQGRISRRDLEQVLDESPELAADKPVIEQRAGGIRRRDLLVAGLLHPLPALTGCQLNWQIEEMQALRRFQPDVSRVSRQRLLESARRSGQETESEAIADLWSGCLASLNLEFNLLHPEELMDLSPEQAEAMLSQLNQVEESDRGTHPAVRREAARALDRLLSRVGPDLTLRGLLLHLTGEDILDDIRPLIIRHIANFLDQGLAAWHSPYRSRGFYASWRASAVRDLTGLYTELPEWLEEIAILDPDPLETLVAELQRLQLPLERWEVYLERLALELPGWSGMVLWRHHHPGYADLPPVEMLDYLTVRLVLERLFAQRLCRQHWQVAPSLDMLRWYFRSHRTEFLVRDFLNNRHLPEYLANKAQRLVRQSNPTEEDEPQWRQLADMIWTWHHSPAADRPEGYSVYRSAWRLFRLAQHLGLSGADIRSLEPRQLDRIFDCLDRLTPEQSGFIWLQAYERHYRDQLFNAIIQNHGRNQSHPPDERPEAQVVWCMDEREEAIRRHLEQLDPHIETFGAAAHYNVPHNWRGLDDREVSALCPVVMVPTHEIRETARPAATALAELHRGRHRLRLWLKDLLHQETRRNLLGSAALMALAAPGALALLAARLLTPLALGQLSERLRQAFEPPVATDISITAAADTPAGSITHNRLGFSDAEQVERLESFLRNIGLLSGFSRLVIVMGHGSSSQNNPHRAAYDCGACSGRHSGPNARVLAAIANRPEIRERLRERGIDIPQECRFLGAFHNTCDERIDWLDRDQVPASHRAALTDIERSLEQACRESAHERCRKFFSAPYKPTRQRALRHVQARARDFSQPRPELGHATNAAAFIGRRAATRGVFFDRRLFLISYDPSTDPDGEVLERLLLANGPVGAGISLEYYFSTVNNDRYGCGSKVLHNVNGLFGVMEGASSDLRTGLPKQMIEIHEAMRLQVIVEARIELLSEIYRRQPPLQELIGNGWLLLSAKDPDGPRIDVFHPERGWERWSGPLETLPTVARASDWYAGHMEPLQPVLLQQSEAASHA